MIHNGAPDPGPPVIRANVKMTNATDRRIGGVGVPIEAADANQHGIGKRPENALAR
jgi:hypothetical protein